MKGLLLSNRLIVAAGLTAALGFAVFVIFFILQPSPSSEVPSTPTPATTQTTMQAQIEPPDTFMNIEGHVSIQPYGLYTAELVIQPSECHTPVEGVTYLKVGDICTISIDRNTYPYIYGRGLSNNFDITSPLNSDSLFVVQLKGMEPFSILTLNEGFLENTQRLPSDVLILGSDVFGFDIGPDTVTWNLNNPLADPN